jgi:hypothetical protein
MSNSTDLAIQTLKRLTASRDSAVAIHKQRLLNRRALAAYDRKHHIKAKDGFTPGGSVGLHLRKLPTTHLPSSVVRDAWRGRGETHL